MTAHPAHHITSATPAITAAHSAARAPVRSNRIIVSPPVGSSPAGNSGAALVAPAFLQFGLCVRVRAV